MGAASTNNSQCHESTSTLEHRAFLYAVCTGDVKGVRRFVLRSNAFLCTTYSTRRLSALHFAARSGHLKVVTLLLTHGANVNMVDLYGATALALAIREHKTDVVQALLDNGADPNVSDLWGISSVHLAARYGRSELLPLLFHAGGDLECRSKVSLWTPLHYATFYGTESCVSTLLDLGADRFAVTKESLCASDIAFNRMMFSILSILSRPVKLS